MIITRHANPFRPYAKQRGFDFLHELIDSLEQREEDEPMVDFKPQVNTREGEEAYHVEVDLPGIEKDNIDINVDKNILTVSGKREMREEVKEENYYKLESKFGSFSRSFTLPEKVDVENISAASDNGVLEIVIPKLKIIEEETKKIEIK